MKANNVKEAWAMADEIFPTDYMKDEQSSANAGYPIYRSTLDPKCTDNYQPWYCQIADLGCRLEVTVTLASWEQKVINIWIEAPAEETPAAVEAPAEEAAPQGLDAISPERKDLVKRLRRAAFAYTREYLDELENKEKEEAECKAAQEAYEKDGVVRCIVMTAENNAKVMLGCMKDMKRAIEILEDRAEDVDDWMMAGITAMLDKAGEMKIIPFDLPTSICGVLGADWRN